MRGRIWPFMYLFVKLKAKMVNYVAKPRKIIYYKY